jgi:hypothetical protein
MNALALGTSLVGQVAGGVANYKAGKAAISGGKAEASSEAMAAEYNAQRSLQKDKFQMAAGRATAGASGVSTTSGTPLDIALYSAMQAEMDANAIRYGGKVRGAEAIQRGQIVGRSFKNRATAGYVGAGTTMASWLNTYGGNGIEDSQSTPGNTSSFGDDWAERYRGKFTISG